MIIAIRLLMVLGFSALLIKSTDIIAHSLEELAKITKARKFALTSFLLAFATSVPELVVGVTAALEGGQNLALGTVMGSNIANISLVVGGAALLGGSFAVSGEFLKLDIFSVFLAGVLPLILLLDRSLSRADGLILLLVYGVYNFGILKDKNKRRVENVTGGLIKNMFKKTLKLGMNRWMAWLCLGATMLVFSADMIVKNGEALALVLGIPEIFIGLFLVSIGTSLPELSFDIKAIRKNQVGMMLGDLFGSVVANSTLVLGIVAIMAPIELKTDISVYLLASAVFGVMFLLFWYFVRTKKKLERWEGVVLILVYTGFLLFEWFR